MIDKNELRPGDIVWGCGFKSTVKGMGFEMLLKQKPILGVITIENKEDLDKKCMLEMKPEVIMKSGNYFVPFRKGSNRKLAWSKAVMIDSRMYAHSYEESMQMYNDAIEKECKYFESIVERLKKEKIQ